MRRALPQFLPGPPRPSLLEIPVDWLGVLDVMGGDLLPEEWARRIGCHVRAVDLFLGLRRMTA